MYKVACIIRRLMPKNRIELSYLIAVDICKLLAQMWALLGGNCSLSNRVLSQKVVMRGFLTI